MRQVYSLIAIIFLDMLEFGLQYARLSWLSLFLFLVLKFNKYYQPSRITLRFYHLILHYRSQLHTLQCLVSRRTLLPSADL